MGWQGRRLTHSLCAGMCLYKIKAQCSDSWLHFSIVMQTLQLGQYALLTDMQHPDTDNANLDTIIRMIIHECCRQRHQLRLASS